MSQSLKRLLPVCALVLSSATASAAGKVWIVAPVLGPGVDYTTIQAAVNAAAAGDTVVVKSGYYSGFSIVGKGLTVTAEITAIVQVNAFASPVCELRDLPAGQELVLSGLQLGEPYFLTNPTVLSIKNCAGTVLISNTSIKNGTPSADVQSSSSVVFDTCTLAGGSDSNFGSGSGNALRCQQSLVVLDYCQATGGSGASYYTGPAYPVVSWGKPAVQVTGGELIVVGGSYVGGGGGQAIDDSYYGCKTGGAGGHGIWLAAGAPVLHRVGGTLAGGPGGWASGSCPAGADGAGLQIDSGVADFADAAPLALSAASPMREGMSMLVLLEAGSSAQLGFVLVAGQSLQPLWLSGLSSALLLSPVAIVPIGFVPANGATGLYVSIGELGPGVESARLVLQSAGCDPLSGNCWLGNATPVVLLDAAL